MKEKRCVTCKSTSLCGLSAMHTFDMGNCYCESTQTATAVVCSHEYSTEQMRFFVAMSTALSTSVTVDRATQVRSSSQ